MTFLIEIFFVYYVLSCEMAFTCTFVILSVKFTGKCIPIVRGGGIYQEHMDEALDRLTEGAWVLSIILYLLKYLKNFAHFLVLCVSS